MEAELLELKHSIKQLETHIQQILLKDLEKDKIIAKLREDVDTIAENKKEIYYQKFLEKHLQASHKVTKYGITDITTDTAHIEIKCWKGYKACVGQLLCYNHNDNKQMIAAFYGDYKDKTKVIELCHDKGIEVWDLVKSPNDVDIVKHHLPSTLQPNDNLVEWLNKHIVLQQGSKLEAKVLSQIFFACQHGICNQSKGAFIKRVELHIKSQFPGVDNKNKVRKNGNLQFRVG